MLEGAWPRVVVDGRLENAETEWLHTNGAGAYAMSTIAMMHTRRYHGILIAALEPPLKRFVIVSHLDTRVVTARQTFRLSTHQFPGTAPTPGYRLLESFAQDPLPRWIYRLGEARLERTLCLVRGKNAVIVAYTWHGRRRATLATRPLMPMRDAHTLTREHGSMVQRVRLYPGRVQIRPVKTLPSVVFGHDGTFLGSPDWYRRFEYEDDRERAGAPSEEDLWTPGTFELPLEPRKTTYLVIALDGLPEEPHEELVAAAARHIEDLDPGFERPVAVRQLWVAAEAFCADACEKPAIVAGYPWYDVESRDLLISLPGLYLVRGRVEQAKRVLETVIAAMRDGYVPKRIRNEAQAEHVSAADASLWLFEAARLLATVVGASDDFVREELYPALLKVFERVRARRQGILWVTRDGLIANGDSNVPLTWMDARVGDQAATPRYGLAVEFQALWSRGCSTLAALSRHYGETSTARAAEAASLAARQAFRRRFWCAQSKYPYDCLRIDADENGVHADPTIRPNGLIALDVEPELFERWQAVAIVTKVRERLLTPRGVRTLDPDDPDYRGAYTGDYFQRRTADHQGMAWTYLIGSYARAALRLTPDDFDLQEDLREVIEEARRGNPVLGQVPQLSDGEPPHRPGGCPAQAWSVAELLRTLVWDLRA